MNGLFVDVDVEKTMPHLEPNSTAEMAIVTVTVTVTEIDTMTLAVNLTMPLVVTLG